jgi:hypothetical protein
VGTCDVLGSNGGGGAVEQVGGVSRESRGLRRA